LKPTNLDEPIVLVFRDALALDDGLEDGADLHLDLVHRVQAEQGTVGLRVDGLGVEDALQVPDPDPAVVTFRGQFFYFKNLTSG
jgi:hypothetical protein